MKKLYAFFEENKKKHVFFDIMFLVKDMEKKKKKEKKEKKALTKKQIIIMIFATIVLGISAYFLGAGIAKAVLDYQNKDKNNFSDLLEVDTTKEITLSDLLSRFNQLVQDHDLSSYQIDENALTDTDQGKSITISDVQFVFQTGENGVKITAINYKEETEEIKELAVCFMLANQEKMSEEDASLLYDKVWETKNNSKKDGNYTSEFFQYLGIEVSLKTWQDHEYPYQLRIGRITE